MLRVTFFVPLEADELNRDNLMDSMDGIYCEDIADMVQSTGSAVLVEGMGFDEWKRRNHYNEIRHESDGTVSFVPVDSVNHRGLFDLIDKEVVEYSNEKIVLKNRKA